jgi:hypothetical protein
MLKNQLSLFDNIQIPAEQEKRFICGKEYRRLNLLSPKTCQHKPVWVNDAICEGYEAAAETFEIYFDNEKDRDEYLDELNQVCGIDNKGNNFDGYHKIWNYRNDKKFDYGIQRLWTKSIFNRECEYSKSILSEYLNK